MLNDNIKAEKYCIYCVIYVFTPYLWRKATGGRCCAASYPEKQSKHTCLRSCCARWTFDTDEDNTKVLNGCCLSTYGLILLINTRCMMSNSGV